MMPEKQDATSVSLH